MNESYYILASMMTGASSIRPLHITQSTLLEVETQIAVGRSPVPFGLLAGKYCVCPETGMEYLLIDETKPSGRTLTSDDPASQLSSELKALIADATRRRKLVLGWYIGGMDDDLRLDQEVIGLHHQLFPEPWNLVLVRSDEAGIQRGAFLRYQAMSAQLYAIPFFELVSDVSKSVGRSVAGAELRSAVRWVNYRTQDAVLPLASAPATAGTTPPPQATVRTKAAVSEWMERLRGGVRAEFPTRAQQRSSAAPVPQSVVDVESAVRVDTEPESSTRATASVDRQANSLPAQPVRIAFPALLPESSVADEELPPPPKQVRLVVWSLGAIGLLTIFWLIWFLLLR